MGAEEEMEGVQAGAGAVRDRRCQVGPSTCGGAAAGSSPSKGSSRPGSGLGTAEGRVVVGLSLTEQAAHAFLAAVTL